MNNNAVYTIYGKGYNYTQNPVTIGNVHDYYEIDYWRAENIEPERQSYQPIVIHLEVPTK